jgi:hypothetical protein
VFTFWALLWWWAGAVLAVAAAPGGRRLPSFAGWQAVRSSRERYQAAVGGIQVTGQVPAPLDGAHGGGDRAAPLVPENHDQRRPVFQRAVLGRGRHQAVNHLGAGADGEQASGPWPKTVSGGTRESVQGTTVANGPCRAAAWSRRLMPWPGCSRCPAARCRLPLSGLARACAGDSR